MTKVQPGDRVVVTGVTGFVGQALSEELARAGYRVAGISDRAAAPTRLQDYLDDYYSIDLTRGWPAVGPYRGLVHLAGLASVGPSFERPQDYIEKNSSMLTNLFESALKNNWNGRAIVVSSGAVYGKGQPSGGLTEDSPLLASSPYVVSKLLLENQTAYYAQRGIDALVARPFNHIGPRQRPGFIVPDLTQKVMDTPPNSKVVVGNLDSMRDYTDVRDIAMAYRLLLELEAPCYSIYNVCSGSSRSGWEILEMISRGLGAPVPEVEIKSDRAIDPSEVTGNAARLNKETGWEPIIEPQSSINDYISSIRHKIC